MTGLATPIFDRVYPKNFYQFLIYVNLYQHAKYQLISLISFGVWSIEESYNRIGWQHFDTYLRNKNFSKYGICAGTQQMI